MVNKKEILYCSLREDKGRGKETVPVLQLYFYPRMQHAWDKPAAAKPGEMVLHVDPSNLMPKLFKERTVSTPIPPRQSQDKALPPQAAQSLWL